MLAVRCNAPPPRRQMYVATGGNDTSGNGTIGTPWKTIAKGVNNAKAGDTIFVRAGTYAAQVDIFGKYGKRDQPIIIKNFAAESVIITTNDWIDINIRGSDWIVIDGLKLTDSVCGVYISNASRNVIRNCEVYAITTDVAIHVLTTQGACYNNVIHHNNCHDNGEEVIYIDIKTANEVANDDNIVECNTITDNGWEGLQNTAEDGTPHRRPARTIFRGNVISGGGGVDYAEADLGGEGLIIQNNTITGPANPSGQYYAAPLIIASCTNGIISGNTVTNPFPDTPSWADGVTLNNSSYNLVTNNTTISDYGDAADGIKEVGTSGNNTKSGNTKSAP